MYSQVGVPHPPVLQGAGSGRAPRGGRRRRQQRSAAVAGPGAAHHVPLPHGQPDGRRRGDGPHTGTGETRPLITSRLLEAKEARAHGLRSAGGTRVHKLRPTDEDSLTTGGRSGRCLHPGLDAGMGRFLYWPFVELRQPEFIFPNKLRLGSDTVMCNVKQRVGLAHKEEVLTLFGDSLQSCVVWCTRRASRSEVLGGVERGPKESPVRSTSGWDVCFQ